MEKTQGKAVTFSIIMTLIVWAILEFDGIGMIPSINSTIAMVLPVLVWLIGGLLVMIKISRQNKTGIFYNANRFVNRDYLVLFFTVVGGIAIAVSNYIYADLSPLFVREYLSGHVLYTVRNVLYYPLEVLLMLELLICSQSAGESLTKKINVPYGAFALFILWGLPHIVYHGFSDGIVSALRAFIYCIPFYASNKNFKTSYICMLILWLM